MTPVRDRTHLSRARADYYTSAETGVNTRALETTLWNPFPHGPPSDIVRARRLQRHNPGTSSGSECTLDDWHPVLLARDLRRKPLSVCLFGVNYVLFRTRSGHIGALLDCCPHRHMRLSLGHVEGEQIICPYHGWRLSPSGAAQTPTRCEFVASGATLLRLPSTITPSGEETGNGRSAADPYPGRLPCRSFRLPHCEGAGRNPVRQLHQSSTAFAHWKFGYDLKTLNNIEHTVTNQGDHTLIEVAGPQKALPWLLEAATGVRSGDTFRIRYQTFYRPLRAEFEWWWEDAATQQDRGFHFKEIAYFMQVEKQRAAADLLFLEQAGAWAFRLESHDGGGHVAGYRLRDQHRRVAG